MATMNWFIDGKNYETEIRLNRCEFCRAYAITELPPPIKAKQTDGTTHVCNPALGGCNHGFTLETRCPYCATPAREATPEEETDRYVNGIRPIDPKASGCEFCKPMRRKAGR